VAHSYLDVKKAEKEAFRDQTGPLRDSILSELADFREEYDAQKTLESQVARDADILECLIQCKEYMDQGFTSAAKFLKKGPSKLLTKSAKELWEGSRDWNSDRWWEELGTFER
jgi:5'-deoxynucleotidase YfbR-like HD superfamily hydrolase